jgi:septal ring factor EnvC (AmiA/AmiB activator)
MIADGAGAAAAARGARIAAVAEPGVRLPWLLVAGSAILAVLLAYVLVAGYLPAKRRIAGLERELGAVYTREAELQTRLAEQERRQAQRDQQVIQLRAERGALTRRIEELERALERTRPGRR